MARHRVFSDEDMVHALRDAGGNPALAAEMLGCDRTTFIFRARSSPDVRHFLHSGALMERVELAAAAAGIADVLSADMLRAFYGVLVPGYLDGPEPPPVPTAAPPGTPDKIRAMTRRVQNGYQPNHRRDLNLKECAD